MLYKFVDIRYAKYDILIIKGEIMKKNRFIAICFILLLTLITASCARTVTSKVIIGDDLQVELTLRGSPDALKYRYYFVFSASRTPLLPPSLQDYLVGPGEVYDETRINVGTGTDVDIDYYYQNYFYSWSDFVVYKDSTFYLTNSTNQGGYFDANTTTPNHYDNNSINPNFSYTSEISSNKITLTFPLSMFSTSNVTAIYFRIFTVDENSYMTDYTASTEVLTNEVNNYISGTELTDTTLDSALDISSWKLRII